MKTIVISLGGSLINPDKIDYDFIKRFKGLISTFSKKYKFVIVTGGGNTARIYINALKKEDINEKLQCLIGIRVTRLNAWFMTNFFNGLASKTIAKDLKEVQNLIKKNNIIFCGSLRYEDKNIMVYTKYSGSRENELTKLYRDNVRMALLLYKNFGLDGMVSLIKSGRGKIKEVEELCLEGKYSEIDLKKGNWNKEFDNLSDYFLTMQRSLVVSPLAYYLAENLKEKDSLEDIINKKNLNKDEALKAFKELQERLFLIAINKGIIEYDSSKRYLNVGALRYEN